MSTANRKKPARGSSSRAWILLMFVGVLGAAIWQWRVNMSSAKDHPGNQRLQEEPIVTDPLKTENTTLREDREKLLQSHDEQAQQIRMLRSEVRQLRKLTNKLATARLAAPQVASLDAQNFKAFVRSRERKNAAAPPAQRMGPWLGVNIKNTGEDGLEMIQGGGVLIIQVNAGSPAAHANIRPGDIVLRVDGQAVSRTDEFTSVMAQKEVGQDVALDLFRKNDVVRVDVTPLDWPQR